MIRKSRPKIVILGSMCRLPVAGVVMQILHYMLGFERLGFDAFYVEWHGNWVADPTDAAGAQREPRLPVAALLRSHGFGARWICRADQLGAGATFGGLAPERLRDLYKEAAAIVNVTGAHVIEGEQFECPCRIYVESDPGIPQIRLENRDPKMWELVNGHTHHFTFGENIHRPGCLLPAGLLDFVPTRQPIVLDLWEQQTPALRDTFTTVARWRKPKEKTIEFRGEVYRWNKDVEFEKFLDLPARSRQSLELALSEIDSKDRVRLEAHGWNVVDAIPLSSSIDTYRAYIQGSRGEFTIAKDQYVRLDTGWFSDRSACYLAAGRPVITQETGFSRVLPTGDGLFAFRTLDDVLAAIDAINSDYERHSEAAREIAREYFDATRVLTDLLAASGLDCKADARLAQPAGVVNGSSALPRVVHREHPEVLALVRRLLGVSRFDDCSLIEEDLRRGRVLRLTCELDAGVRRVVVKRFAADRARVEQAVLRRWLPSVGLAHLAPKLLGVAVESAGGHVWHAYEDLGDFSLDHESRFASRGAADRGFLSPLRQSPEREHLELVVDAIAAVHESFEGHALLGECRRESTGFGSRSLRESVDEAIEALQRSESTAREPEAERRLDAREDLLEILQRVRAECEWRGRLVEQLGGPDTLLHGDLGVRNALACMTARGMTGMLIDWDHAGVGPVSYDLSTLLMQLPAADRRWVLRRYQARRARDGGWPTHKQWNLLFETAELSRLASCVIGPAIAAAAGEPEWALDDLAKIRAWFGSLTPVLPDEDADAAAVGDVAARQESREA